MTFWLGVSVAYLLIMIVGLSLGLALAHRFPGDGRGPWDIPDQWTPAPSGGGLSLDEEFAELVASMSS